MRINIIDPTSTEFNRGSFCYAPYLCYNGLADRNEVCLMESFRAEDLDTIPTDADIHIVTLWSYPQIECAILLTQMIPFSTGEQNVYFVGYKPLILHLGLRHIEELFGFDPLQDSDFLLLAMRNYPKNYKKFKRLLLSDCDMHMKHLEQGELVYPLFTSYGCSRGCQFCPSTKNCGKQRIEISICEVQDMLDECIVQGIKSIHFTDEDFFFDIDRAFLIMQYLEDKGMHLIALSSAEAASTFIDKYGTSVLQRAGLEVMEIGFESASEEVSKSMGVGKSLSDCEKLAAIQHELPFNIFWLVLTFFPGETIKSLNTTGEFLLKYGFDEKDVVGRLRTNGTKGGLGQFFQSYVGTGIYRKLANNGFNITERPIRLIPSYIPNSFLDSRIDEICKDKVKEAKPWLKLYNVSFPVEHLMIGATIRQYMDGRTMQGWIQASIALAIYARMGVIK